MKINKVSIEGFLSIKKAEINFEDYSGLIRVEGKNQDTKPFSSNGAGKSSIIEAVVFALFGRTIRKKVLGFGTGIVDDYGPNLSTRTVRKMELRFITMGMVSYGKKVTGRTVR